MIQIEPFDIEKMRQKLVSDQGGAVSQLIDFKEIKACNLLIDGYYQNDSYRRCQGLEYANVAQLREKLQQVQMDKHNATSKLKRFVKSVEKFLTIQRLEKLKQVHAEVIAQHTLQDTESDGKRALLTGNLRKWRYITCESGDLLERAQYYLPELEAFVSYYRRKIQFHYGGWRRVFKKNKPATVKTLEKQLARMERRIKLEKRFLISSMLYVLQNISLFEDVTLNDGIHLYQQQVMPAHTPYQHYLRDVSASGEMNAKLFMGLHRYILEHGDTRSKLEIEHLRWFKQGGICLIKTECFNKKEKLIVVPEGSHGRFDRFLMRWFSWLPSMKRRQAFLDKQFYHLVQINFLEKKVGKSNVEIGKWEGERRNAIAALEEGIDQLERHVQQARQLENSKGFGINQRYYSRWNCVIRETRGQVLKHKLKLARVQYNTLMRKFFEQYPLLLHVLEMKNDVLALTTDLDNMKQEAKKQFQYMVLKDVEDIQEKLDFIATYQPVIIKLGSGQYGKRMDLNLFREDCCHDVDALLRTTEKPEKKISAISLLWSILSFSRFPKKALVREVLGALFPKGRSNAGDVENFVRVVLAPELISRVKHSSEPAFQFVNAWAPDLATQWLVDQMKTLKENLAMACYPQVRQQLSGYLEHDNIVGVEMQNWPQAFVLSMEILYQYAKESILEGKTQTFNNILSEIVDKLPLVNVQRMFKFIGVNADSAMPVYCWFQALENIQFVHYPKRSIFFILLLKQEDYDRFKQPLTEFISKTLHLPINENLFLNQQKLFDAYIKQQTSVEYPLDFDQPGAAESQESSIATAELRCLFDKLKSNQGCDEKETSQFLMRYFALKAEQRVAPTQEGGLFLTQIQALFTKAKDTLFKLLVTDGESHLAMDYSRVTQYVRLLHALKSYSFEEVSEVAADVCSGFKVDDWLISYLTPCVLHYMNKQHYSSERLHALERRAGLLLDPKRLRTFNWLKRQKEKGAYPKIKSWLDENGHIYIHYQARLLQQGFIQQNQSAARQKCRGAMGFFSKRRRAEGSATNDSVYDKIGQLIADTVSASGDFNSLWARFCALNSVLNTSTGEMSCNHTQSKSTPSINNP